MSSNLRPIAPRQSLRKQVYNKLREALRSGVITGSRLLVERELAEQLGVSRTPVREALALLERDGILVATGRGFTPKILNDAEIRDLYEIRQLLEPHAIASVTENLSDSILETLEAHVETQKQGHNENDAEMFTEANTQFRACWIGEVANPRLAEDIERYDDHIVFLRKITLVESRYRNDALESQEYLMNALLKRDVASVKELMSMHLTRAERALRKALRETSLEAHFKI